MSVEIHSERLKYRGSIRVLQHRKDLLPRASAFPDVVRPPKPAAPLSKVLHISEVRVSPPVLALATTAPFWRYFLVIEIRLPEAVPSLVLNWVTTVNDLDVSTVPPGP